MKMKKIGQVFGLFAIGVMVSVIMGIVAYSVVTQMIANMTPAPTGTEALVIGLVPLFSALMTAVIPIMGVYTITGGRL